VTAWVKRHSPMLPISMFGIVLALVAALTLPGVRVAVARALPWGSHGAGMPAPGSIPPSPSSAADLRAGASEVVTAGHQFTDRSGRPILLKSIMWEGFNDIGMMAHGLDRQPLSYIAGLLKHQGFDSVRLLFSNGMLHFTHRKTDAAVAQKNPELAGLIPRQAFYRVVEEITKAGLYVVIDNHQTRSGYFRHDEGQWFTANYDESRWLRDWDYVAYLFRANPRVIGYEFRNEVRSNHVDPTEPVWGGGGKYDWRRAQVAAATTVWRRNPAKIAFISGLDYDSTLVPVVSDPITAKDFPDMHGPIYLAYSVHSFAWFSSHDAQGKSLNIHLFTMAPAVQRQVLYASFGFVAASNAAYTAPIWLSEFGVTPDASDTYAATFKNLLSYLSELHISFGYYTLSSWYPKQPQYMSHCYDNAPTAQQDPGYGTHCNNYGLLDRDWSRFVDDWRLEALKPLLSSP